MNKFLSILAVILFWISMIVVIPLTIIFGSIVILFYMSWSVSAIVYDIVSAYLRKKSI